MKNLTFLILNFFLLYLPVTLLKGEKEKNKKIKLFIFLNEFFSYLSEQRIIIFNQCKWKFKKESNELFIE